MAVAAPTGTTGVAASGSGTKDGLTLELLELEAPEVVEAAGVVLTLGVVDNSSLGPAPLGLVTLGRGAATTTSSRARSKPS